MSFKSKTQVVILNMLSEVLSEEGTNDEVDLLKLTDSLIQSLQTEKRNRNGKSELIFNISDDSICFQVTIRFNNNDEIISHEIEFHQTN